MNLAPGARTARSALFRAGITALLLAAWTIEAFVSRVDSAGNSQRWVLSPPEGAVSTNVFNPRTKAIRYFLGSEGFSRTNTVAELNAVRACFDQWQSVPGTNLKFEEGGTVDLEADVNTSDQTNVLFWAKSSTLVNGGRDSIWGTLAVTFPRFTANNVLLEADIVLNGVQFAWFTDFQATTNAGQFVEATVLHEIGHFIGLDHSPVGGATLFARGADGLSPQAGLSSDEAIAVRTLYPASPSVAARGQLQGRVTAEGSAVFGASVVAEDAAGNIASGTMTDANGFFQLPGLEPGAYRVRAAPLDPPSMNSLERLMTGGDIAPAFSGAHTTFSPTTNHPVMLVGGQTNSLDLPVIRREPAFRITRIRPPARELDPLVAINAPATIALGRTNWVVGVFSPNLPT
ncbi:MAG: carboxypeptidase regulatory-like domain-containing protein, partial [Phycisphaerales bacterium]|nr:carboxypeptidase regulatory-like domain-containing protein [Phycisphaerales bacterium]